VRKAVGSFSNGTLIDEWRHFDSSGKLVAVARPMSPWTFGGAGYLLDVKPSAERVRQWVHQGFVAGTRHRLDYLADGSEQLYVHDTEDIAYDAGGHKLARVDGQWQESDCHWNHLRRVTARSGDVVTLHGLTLDRDTCDGAKPIAAERAKHIEAMLASMHASAASEPHPAAPIRDLASSIATSMASMLGRPEVESHSPSPQAPPVVAAR
jgi:hypothetical protein